MTAKQKQIIANNPHRQKAHQILNSKGYHLQTGGESPTKTFWIEFYAGPKGSLILQTFPDETHGVITYAAWPTGNTWEELKACLSD